MAQEEKLSADLDEWLVREELIWKQRSRMVWLKEGGRKTTFFRAKATMRNEKKLIDTLQIDDESTITEIDDISSEFTH